MPLVANGPIGLNRLLEEVYSAAKKKYKDKSRAAAYAWAAAKNAGWHKDKGKWSKDMEKAD